MRKISNVVLFRLNFQVHFKHSEKWRDCGRFQLPNITLGANYLCNSLLTFRGINVNNISGEVRSPNWPVFRRHLGNASILIKARKNLIPGLVWVKQSGGCQAHVIPSCGVINL